jgi:hypothetical protein
VLYHYCCNIGIISKAPLQLAEINQNLLENEMKKEKEHQILFYRIGCPQEIAKIAFF